MPYMDNYRDKSSTFNCLQTTEQFLPVPYLQQYVFTFSVPRCPFLEAPRNGWMTAGLFTEGTNISFHCNDRYYLEGPSYIMCLEGALWDNDPPVCKSEVENSNI